MVVLLMVLSIYLQMEYEKLNCEYNELQNKYQNRGVLRMVDSVTYMNAYYKNPELLSSQLNSMAKAYFIMIGKGDSFYVSQLKEKGYACLNWEENTKAKYEKLFFHDDRYKSDMEEDEIREGLNVVNSVCVQKNIPNE